MGSIPGAFLAALLIAEIKAMCFAIGQTTLFGMSFSFSKLDAGGRVPGDGRWCWCWRPWGLLGRPSGRDLPQRRRGRGAACGRPDARTRGLGWIALVAVLAAVAVLASVSFPYPAVLAIDVLDRGACSRPSLHFIMGPGGMHSFGHAAYFGLGAYGAGAAGQATRTGRWRAALHGRVRLLGGGWRAVIFGWFCVRLSGVYLARC
jgi:branched-chain amino acid transport system permease protein